ncbi:hypothetical protein D3C81_1086520 [compost metagenome]
MHDIRLPGQLGEVFERRQREAGRGQVQVKLGAVGQVVGHRLVARRPAVAEVEHLRIDTFGSATFGDLENDLLDTAHGVGVVGLEKMQNLDHCPSLTLR